MKRKWARKPITESNRVVGLPKPAPIADAPVKNQFERQTVVQVYLGDKYLGLADNVMFENPVTHLSDIWGRFVAYEPTRPDYTVTIGNVVYHLIEWEMNYGTHHMFDNVHVLKIKRAELRG